MSLSCKQTDILWLQIIFQTEHIIGGRSAVFFDHILLVSYKW